MSPAGSPERRRFGDGKCWKYFRKFLIVHGIFPRVSIKLRWIKFQAILPTMVSKAIKSGLWRERFRPEMTRSIKEFRYVKGNRRSWRMPPLWLLETMIGKR